MNCIINVFLKAVKVFYPDSVLHVIGTGLELKKYVQIWKTFTWNKQYLNVYTLDLENLKGITQTIFKNLGIQVTELFL